MKTLFVILVLAFTLSAQTLTKPQEVRFHVAQVLLSKEWTPQQTSVLLRAINSPTKDLESEAVALFASRQVKDIFYKIGSRDTSSFRAAYNADVLADKKHLVIADRTIWRTDFAYLIATNKYNAEQLDYFIRVSAVINDKDKLGQMQEEARTLFKDMSIFTEIGPYKSLGTMCSSNVSGGGDCVCSVGSWFNGSCKNSCSSGGCSNTQDGCGFLWAYACNGSCQTESEESN